ncbi:hypothetical protein BBH99_12245 [Chryseobacterium contaminans]|uniref:Uncharacterized protein n=1 Tax=Chryseobacterium contaminans TaxID=1423959 RepID=A0ABX2X288_9FLAO|nr:hypothetical protein BBH99_12245 [Chryseobacterium contaminans]
MLDFRFQMTDCLTSDVLRLLSFNISIYFFIFDLENKKADNLFRLSAVILSQNFRAHNFPFMRKTLFIGGLNFHLFFFLQK